MEKFKVMLGNILTENFLGLTTMHAMWDWKCWPKLLMKMLVKIKTWLERTKGIFFDYWIKKNDRIGGSKSRRKIFHEIILNQMHKIRRILDLDHFSRTKKKILKKIVQTQIWKMSNGKSNIKKTIKGTEVDFFLKWYLRFQLRWDDSLDQRAINNIKVDYLLLRM